MGIVAEYNPFHTGHGYQIAQSRAVSGENRPVVAVMSGNWVQQADCAVADKWKRARLALMGGCDLVLELPTVFATASAEKFAQGAVEILHATGVVDTLSFGSECGDVAALTRVALGLDSEEYRAALRELTDSGAPFALCRQQAAEQVLGQASGSLLSTPNNNLGVEYIRALHALKSPVRPMTVQRRGAAHNALHTDRPEHLSATQIRARLRGGEGELIADYLVDGALELLTQNPLGLPRLERLERLALARLRTMTAEDWGKLPDSGASEGLPRRLEKAGHSCRSLEEFYALTKTRRYTHARLRRLVLWALLGMTAELRPDHPVYIRVLGFNERGQALLKQMKTAAALPVITKPAHAGKLDGAGRAMFELESRFTDLYDLCYETLPVPGREWTMDAVRVEGSRNG